MGDKMFDLKKNGEIIKEDWLVDYAVSQYGSVIKFNLDEYGRIRDYDICDNEYDVIFNRDLK